MQARDFSRGLLTWDYFVEVITADAKYNFYCSRFAQARNYDLGFEPQKQNGQTELATLSAI